MIDRRRIVRQWQEGKASALVTLVRVEGSSYRRPGARLLTGPGGEAAGSISGGCLEAEVIRKAAWKIRDGALIETYSTLFDDTAEIPYGLGCGGVVDLLFEPANTPEAAALLEAVEASLADEQRVIATWLPQDGKPLMRAVFDAAGTLLFASEPLTASGTVSTGINYLPALEQDSIFLEKLAGPQRLFVFGAGDDARPLVTMASLLGWNVIVADGRPHLARPERFPEAEHVLATGGIQSFAFCPSDAAVLMTHSYEQDRAQLAELLAQSTATKPGYIGLLGARHRSALLVSETATQLGISVAACCERIWAPVGLDLGGDGPEAVALAIVAEVQSWTQGRLARSRRLTAGEVAEQIARGGPSAYLQAQCAADAVHP